jgi:hypothetical protein
MVIIESGAGFEGGFQENEAASLLSEWRLWNPSTTGIEDALTEIHFGHRQTAWDDGGSALARLPRLFSRGPIGAGAE